MLFFFFWSKISGRDRRKSVTTSPSKEALAMKNRQELAWCRSSSSGSQVTLRAMRERNLPPHCLLGRLVSHQRRATWKGCNKWTVRYNALKTNQCEPWKFRNRYLSLVIFHFNVHDFSELYPGIALCLVISKKYEQLHRKKYSHEISI